MPRLEYFVVAESVSVDQTTNRVSVFNILEELQTANFPVIVPQMVAICGWNILPAEIGQDYQVVIRIIAPGEAPRDQRTNFTARHVRQRIFTQVVGLPLAREGELRFEVTLNDRHEASHTVSVVRVDGPPAGVA